MKRLLAIALLIASTSAKGAFMPENELWREDDVNLVGGIDQATFEATITKIQKIYAPIVYKLGGLLNINGSWSDRTVNAYASREGATWLVEMFGGLARRKEVTPDGFVLVVCHELGHHIAGHPFYTDIWHNQMDWSATEGQSDYFATLACFRKVTADEPVAKPGLVPKIIVDKCARAWRSAPDRRMCERATAGGKSLADLLGALAGETASYDKYDPEVVKTTFEGHPAAQCRFDTMLSGALCSAKWDDSVIPDAKNHMRYNCPNRPKCWFFK